MIDMCKTEVLELVYRVTTSVAVLNTDLKFFFGAAPVARACYGLKALAPPGSGDGTISQALSLGCFG
jgi:hypothetical protein